MAALSFKEFVELCTGSYDGKSFDIRVAEIKHNLKTLKLENYDEKRDEDKISTQLLKQDDENCAAAIREGSADIINYLTSKKNNGTENSNISCLHHLHGKPKSILAALTKIAADENYQNKIDELLTEKDTNGQILLERAILDPLFSDEQLAELVTKFYTVKTLSNLVNKIASVGANYNVINKLYSAHSTHSTRRLVLFAIMSKSPEIASQLFLYGIEKDKDSKQDNSWLTQLTQVENWNYLINMLSLVGESTVKSKSVLTILSDNGLQISKILQDLIKESIQGLHQAEAESKVIQIIGFLDPVTLFNEFFEKEDPVFPKIWHKQKLVFTLLQRLIVNNINKYPIKAINNGMGILKKDLIDKILEFKNKRGMSFSDYVLQEKFYLDFERLLVNCSVEWWEYQIEKIYSSLIYSKEIVDHTAVILKFLLSNKKFYRTIHDKLDNQSKEKLKVASIIELKKIFEKQKESQNNFKTVVMLISMLVMIDKIEVAKLIGAVDKQQISHGLQALVKGENEKNWTVEDDVNCSEIITLLLNENIISKTEFFRFLQQVDHSGTPMWVYLRNKPKSLLTILQKVSEDEKDINPYRLARDLLDIQAKNGNRLLKYAAAKWTDNDLAPIIPFYAPQNLAEYLVHTGQTPSDDKVLAMWPQLWSKLNTLFAIFNAVDQRTALALIFVQPEKEKYSLILHAVTKFTDEKLLQLLKIAIQKLNNNPDKQKQFETIITNVWPYLWNKANSTLFLLSHFKNNQELFLSLISYKDKVNHDNRLLHYAAEHYTHDQLKTLVSYYNTDQINEGLLTCNAFSQTPLHVAACMEKTQNVMILMQSSKNQLLVAQAMSGLDKLNRSGYYYLAQRGEKNGKPFTRADVLAAAVKMDEQTAVAALRASDEKDNVSPQTSILFTPLLSKSLDLFVTLLHHVQNKNLNINQDNAEVFLEYLAQYNFRNYYPIPNVFLPLLKKWQGLLAPEKLKSILKIAMKNNNEQDFIAALRLIDIKTLKQIFSSELWAELIEQQSLSVCLYLLRSLQESYPHDNNIFIWKDIHEILILKTQTKKDSALDQAIFEQKIKVLADLMYRISAKLSKQDPQKPEASQESGADEKYVNTTNSGSMLVATMTESSKKLGNQISMQGFVLAMNADDKIPLQMQALIVANDQLRFAEYILINQNAALKTELLSNTNFNASINKIIIDLRSEILSARAAVDAENIVDRLNAMLQKFSASNELLSEPAITHDDFNFLQALINNLIHDDIDTHLLSSTVDRNELIVMFQYGKKLFSNSANDNTEIEKIIHTAKINHKELLTLGWSKITLQMGELLRHVKSQAVVDEKEADNLKQQLNRFSQLKARCEIQDDQQARKKAINYFSQQLANNFIEKSNSIIPPDIGVSVFDQKLLDLSARLDEVTRQPFYLKDRFELIALTQNFIEDYQKPRLFGAKTKHLNELITLKKNVVEGLLEQQHLSDYKAALLKLHDEINGKFKLALQAEGIVPVEKEVNFAAVKFTVVEPPKGKSLEGYSYLTDLQKLLQTIAQKIQSVVSTPKAVVEVARPAPLQIPPRQQAASQSQPSTPRSAISAVSPGTSATSFCTPNSGLSWSSQKSTVLSWSSPKSAPVSLVDAGKQAQKSVTDFFKVNRVRVAADSEQQPQQQSQQQQSLAQMGTMERQLPQAAP